MQPAVNFYPVKEVEPGPEAPASQRVLKEAEQQDLFRKQEAERTVMEKLKVIPIPKNGD